jgi:lipopolysaccharide export system protein LptA
MRRRDLARAALAAAVAVALGVTPVGAEPAREGGGSLFDAGSLGGGKGPITITSDTLEYDYKANVVVYRGAVSAVQGAVKLRADRLTVTLEREGGDDAKTAPPTEDEGKTRVRDIVAIGNVRVDNGTRWATGGKAIFDQAKRTLSLVDNPVLHDGVNEVAGERVVVYLDEDRSVVEGGRKRVKAVLYPGKDGGLAPSGDAAAKGTTAAGDHAAAGGEAAAQDADAGATPRDTGAAAEAPPGGGAKQARTP